MAGSSTTFGLETEVAALAASDLRGYKAHPRTRLLASVYKAITERVPAGPDPPDFRLGKTTGRDYAAIGGGSKGDCRSAITCSFASRQNRSS